MQQQVCVVCGELVMNVLDLNIQPLANNLLSKIDEPFEVYSLGLSGCKHCGHAQLTEFVNPEVLFKDYLYASGTSQTLTSFFKWFSTNLKNALPKAQRVLEIASNDGTLLSVLQADGFDVTGVDPAANLTRLATEKGLNVYTGFFPETTPDGPFDIIIAMNVAAHTPDPLRFMQGIASSLAAGGVAIIQTSQAAMISNGEFDTIYHEHYSFYSVSSMQALAHRAGLVLEQTQLVSVHGTSFLFFVRHPSESEPVNFEARPPYSVLWPQRLPPPFMKNFTGEIATESFKEFSDKSQVLMQTVRDLINGHRTNGYDVALVGVAAKALTFIRAAGIAPDWYFDEAPLKVGRFVPGSSQPIRPLSELARLSKKTVLLVGAWNFAQELMAKMNTMNFQIPHRYLIHLPEVREIMAEVKS